jgi:hypothetical protein
VKKTSVPLAEMAGWAPVDANDYQRTLATLLSASPLTDLATANRAKPPFAWTRHTLAAVATTAGRNLALRAFAMREPSVAVWSRTCGEAGAQAAEVLAKAAVAIPEGSAPRTIADGFVACLREAASCWSSTDSAA